MNKSIIIGSSFLIIVIIIIVIVKLTSGSKKDCGTLMNGIYNDSLTEDCSCGPNKLDAKAGQYCIKEKKDVDNSFVYTVGEYKNACLNNDGDLIHDIQCISTQGNAEYTCPSDKCGWNGETNECNEPISCVEGDCADGQILNTDNPGTKCEDGLPNTRKCNCDVDHTSPILSSDCDTLQTPTCFKGEDNVYHALTNYYKDGNQFKKCPNNMVTSGSGMVGIESCIRQNPNDKYKYVNMNKEDGKGSLESCSPGIDFTEKLVFKPGNIDRCENLSENDAECARLNCIVNEAEGWKDMRGSQNNSGNYDLSKIKKAGVGQRDYEIGEDPGSSSSPVAAGNEGFTVDGSEKIYGCDIPSFQYSSIEFGECENLIGDECSRNDKCFLIHNPDIIKKTKGKKCFPREIKENGFKCEPNQNCNGKCGNYIQTQIDGKSGTELKEMLSERGLLYLYDFTSDTIDQEKLDQLKRNIVCDPSSNVGSFTCKLKTTDNPEGEVCNESNGYYKEENEEYHCFGFKNNDNKSMNKKLIIDSGGNVGKVTSPCYAENVDLKGFGCINREDRASKLFTVDNDQHKIYGYRIDGEVGQPNEVELNDDNIGNLCSQDELSCVEDNHPGFLSTVFSGLGEIVSQYFAFDNGAYSCKIHPDKRVEVTQDGKTFNVCYPNDTVCKKPDPDNPGELIEHCNDYFTDEGGSLDRTKGDNGCIKTSSGPQCQCKTGPDGEQLYDSSVKSYRGDNHVNKDNPMVNQCDIKAPCGKFGVPNNSVSREMLRNQGVSVDDNIPLWDEGEARAWLNANVDSSTGQVTCPDGPSGENCRSYSADILNIENMKYFNVYYKNGKLVPRCLWNDYSNRNIFNGCNWGEYLDTNPALSDGDGTKNARCKPISEDSCSNTVPFNGSNGKFFKFYKPVCNFHGPDIHTTDLCCGGCDTKEGNNPNISSLEDYNKINEEYHQHGGVINPHSGKGFNSRPTYWNNADNTYVGNANPGDDGLKTGSDNFLRHGANSEFSSAIKTNLFTCKRTNKFKSDGKYWGEDLDPEKHYGGYSSSEGGRWVVNGERFGHFGPGDGWQIKNSWGGVCPHNDHSEISEERAGNNERDCDKSGYFYFQNGRLTRVDCDGSKKEVDKWYSSDYTWECKNEKTTYIRDDEAPCSGRGDGECNYKEGDIFGDR